MVRKALANDEIVRVLSERVVSSQAFADKVDDCIDYDEVADGIDLNRLAKQLDLSSLAYEIDDDAVAQKIADTMDVGDLDYERLAKSLIRHFSRGSANC
jgi:hypothetical protein